MHQLPRLCVAPGMEGDKNIGTAEMLREQAERCRRLAEATTDREIAEKLMELAREFDAQANSLEDDTGKE